MQSLYVCLCDQKPTLQESSKGLICPSCQTVYKIVNNVPVLLAKDNLLFSPETVTDRTTSGFSSPWVFKISKMLPDISINLGIQGAFEALDTKLAGQKRDLCLILGAGESGLQQKKLEKYFNKVMQSDVVLSEGTSVVCDAHALPFADNSLDCVVIIAVLEHVINPEQVVSEISRVLKKDGIVFADTPFMQQVHAGAYDFLRFSELGHRWLFRNFVEVKRGMSGGPGSALAWSLSYFLTSFAVGRKSYLCIKLLIRLCFFWLKYFDYLLINQKAALDCASGYYFLGTNNKSPVLNAKELLSEFRGLNR